MANDDVADNSAENSAEKNKVLKNIYYNISSPGSLSGWKKLRDEVEKSVKNVTKDEIMNFLLSQPTYSIFKQVPGGTTMRPQAYFRTNLSNLSFELELYLL